jgi:hypothetical protein
MKGRKIMKPIVFAGENIMDTGVRHKLERYSLNTRWKKLGTK